MAGPVAVEGLADLQRALKHAEREVRLSVRKELRELAKPVQATANALALADIRNMPRSPRWAKMRVGQTRNEVYVVPRQKGVRGRSPRRREKFPGLLADRAMDPTRARFQPQLERRVEQALDRIAIQFNRG